MRSISAAARRLLAAPAAAVLFGLTAAATPTASAAARAYPVDSIRVEIGADGRSMSVQARGSGSSEDTLHVDLYDSESHLVAQRTTSWLPGRVDFDGLQPNTIYIVSVVVTSGGDVSVPAHRTVLTKPNAGHNTYCDGCPVFRPDIQPTRKLDTRGGVDPVQGVFELTGPYLGVGFLDVAVALNVTVIDAMADGYASVYPGPCDSTPRPAISNVNFRAGDTIANMAVVGLGGSELAVCVFVSAHAHLAVDRLGSFLARAPTVQMSHPVRRLDTRGGSPVGSEPVALQLTSGGGAAIVNVTAAEAAGLGYATAWPCDRPMPTTSTVNFTPGRPVPNLAIVPADPDGFVCFAAPFGSPHLIVDSFGTLLGDGFAPRSPVRVYDSRADVKLEPGEVRVLPIQNVVPRDAHSAAVNVTVTEAEDEGFVVLYRCNFPPPGISNVNYPPGMNRANMALLPPGDTCIKSHARTHVVIDVTGWFFGINP